MPRTSISTKIESFRPLCWLSAKTDEHHHRKHISHVAFARLQIFLVFSYSKKVEKFNRSWKLLVQLFNYLKNVHVYLPFSGSNVKLRSAEDLQFWAIPQFYIQLVYKPHFGTWILLFGPFGQLRAAKKKKCICIFLSNFWGWFFQLFVGKKT